MMTTSGRGDGGLSSFVNDVDLDDEEAISSTENVTGRGVLVRVQGDRVIEDDKALVAVAADACALCCLQCTGALVLILYLVQIGLWSWAFHQVYSGLPQTFAWEKLLRTFGAHYDDCVDRNGDIEIELKPPDLCPNVYTTPCLPIIAIVILLMNLFSGTSCLSKPKSKRMYTMVTSSTTWQFIFTAISLVFVSLYFNSDSQRLESSMKRELSKGVPETTRWQLTQVLHKCCGIHKYSDWSPVVRANSSSNAKVSASLMIMNMNSSSDAYPRSCYQSQTVDSGMHKESCYNIEYSIIRFWAIFEIGLLAAGLLTTTFFLCLATAVHGGARGTWKPDRCCQDDGICSNNGAGLYFVRSPHYRHRRFSGRHQHHHHHYSHENVTEAESSGFSTHQQDNTLFDHSHEIPGTSSVTSQ